MIQQSTNRNIYSFTHPPLTGGQVKQECVIKTEKKSVSKKITSASDNASGFFNAYNSFDKTSFAGGKLETFTDISGKVYKGTKVKTWVDNLLEKKSVKNFLENRKLINFSNLAADAPGIMETITSVAVVCTLRPGAILLTPGAEKRDKQYASAKAWASALIDIAVTLAILNPIKKAHQLFMKQAKKTGNLKYLTERGGKDANKQIINFGPKFLTTPIRAAIAIALIPHVMKAIFPKKEKEVESINRLEQPIYASSFKNNNINFGINNKIFKNFLKGGK